MGYQYYTDTVKKFDRNTFQKSIAGCLKIGQFRLNPSLRDVDSLIFLHRTPILAQWFAQLPEGLVCIDIGGRIQPYRSLLETKVTRYIAVDIQMEGLVNVLATAANLPFEGNSCDVILCTDTLQYIPNALGAIKEMHRALKPGGKLMLSTRGFYPEHHDECGRFLPDGLRYLTRMFSAVEIAPEGYSGSGLLTSINVLLHRNVSSPRWAQIAARTSIPLLNRIGMCLDHLIGHNSRSTCSYSLLAIK